MKAIGPQHELNCAVVPELGRPRGAALAVYPAAESAAFFFGARLNSSQMSSTT